MRYPFPRQDYRWCSSIDSLMAVLLALSILCGGACSPIKKEKLNEFYEMHDVMPNLNGFIDVDSPVRGSWYWYPGPKAKTTIVAAQKKGSSKKLKYWLDENPNYANTYLSASDVQVTADDMSTRASQITIVGEISSEPSSPPRDWAVALGFELCAWHDRLPYKLPQTLKNCVLEDETTPEKRFHNISFQLKEYHNVNRVEVQFIQWKTADDWQPRCHVNLDEREDGDESGVPCEYDEKNRRIMAKVQDAKYTTDKAANTIKVDPKSLYKIHLEFLYGGEAPKGNDFGVTITDVVAGFEIPTEDEASENETDTSISYDNWLDDYHPCEVPNASISPDIGGDDAWLDVKYEQDGGDFLFQVMKREVTVNQIYKLYDLDKLFFERYYPDDGRDNRGFYAWTSCNLHLHILDKSYGDQAVNCINRCQAKHFCQMIEGGNLPTEAQWMAAADLIKPPKKWDCGHAVLNDIDDRGPACGDPSRIPKEGCSREEGDLSTKNRPCDMFGNLWEWVSDDLSNQCGEDDEAVCERYKDWGMLKGGSLFTPNDSKALTKDAFTVDHPLMPLSPTQIGFRCIREVPSVPDAGVEE